MSNNETTAMARVGSQDRTLSFEPDSIEQAYKLSGLLVKSQLMPNGINTPEQAFAVIATGRELGLTAMQSIRGIHIIKGKPCLSADLILALVKRNSDVCKYFQMVESSNTLARYKTHRVGDPESTTLSFSIEDAKQAGLMSNDTWRKYPAAMLRARCIAALARAVYPDLVMGIYETNEIEEVLAPMPSPQPQPTKASPPPAVQKVNIEVNAQPDAEAPETVKEVIADAVLDEPEDTSVIDGLKAAIAGAASAEALAEVGKNISEVKKGKGITGEAYKALAVLFSARSKELKAA